MGATGAAALANLLLVRVVIHAHTPVPEEKNRSDKGVKGLKLVQACRLKGGFDRDLPSLSTTVSTNDEEIARPGEMKAACRVTMEHILCMSSNWHVPHHPSGESMIAVENSDRLFMKDADKPPPSVCPFHRRFTHLAVKTFLWHSTVVEDRTKDALHVY